MVEGRFILFCTMLTMSSPIKSAPKAFPGKVVIKMGIFPRIPKPEMETFASHRHEWQGKHEGLDQYKIKIFEDKI